MTRLFGGFEDDGRRPTLHPTNASPDRNDHEDPDYRARKIRWTCQICNFVRGKSEGEVGERRGERLLDAWEAGAVRYQEKKLLEPVIDSRPTLAARDKALVRQRVRSKFHATKQICLKTQLKGRKERRGRRINFCYLTRRSLEASLTAM